MRAMTLYGLSIDEVRDIFGAPPELAARLREVAAARLSGPKPRRRWGLFQRNPELEVDPRKPITQDVDALLTGGFVAQERIEPCWLLFETWLGELSAVHVRLEYETLETIEFDLARRGLPSTNSIRRLGERALGIPLRPPQDMVTGYSHHAHAVATQQALADIDLETVQDATRGVVEPVLEFLSRLPAGKDVILLARPLPS